MSEAHHQASLLHHLAILLHIAGEPAKSKSRFLEALELRRQIKANPNYLARTLAEFGFVVLANGDVAGAETSFREAAKSTEGAGGNSGLQIRINVGLAQVLTKKQSFQEAEKLLQTAWDDLGEGQTRRRALARQIVNSMLDLYKAWSIADPTQNFSGRVDLWQSAQTTKTNAGSSHYSSHPRSLICFWTFLCYN